MHSAKPLNSGLNLALAALALWLLWPLLDWALWHAVWQADATACRAAQGHGACWGVIAEKLQPMLLGRYPHEQPWRPVLACALLTALLLASAQPRCWRWPLVPAWALGLPSFVLLMGGGHAGLASVPTLDWGGLPLTLWLAILSSAIAFPFALALALARHSPSALARALAGVYIEFVRGVPLIAALFMASFLVPLLLPASAQPDLLVRVTLALSLFGAAYLAEVIRGGLQAVSADQADAARALGLSRWQVQHSVVLPQALRAALPALVGNFIGLLKDTSLVTVVGLYELTGAMSLALSGDPVWRSYFVEAMLFIAFIYAALCLALSAYGRWLAGVNGPARAPT